MDFFIGRDYVGASKPFFVLLGVHQGILFLTSLYLMSWKSLLSVLFVDDGGLASDREQIFRTSGRISLKNTKLITCSYHLVTYIIPKRTSFQISWLSTTESVVNLAATS